MVYRWASSDTSKFLYLLSTVDVMIGSASHNYGMSLVKRTSLGLIKLWQESA